MDRVIGSGESRPDTVRGSHGFARNPDLLILRFDGQKRERVSGTAVQPAAATAADTRLETESQRFVQDKARRRPTPT